MHKPLIMHILLTQYCGRYACMVSCQQATQCFNYCTQLQQLVLTSSRICYWIDFVASRVYQYTLYTHGSIAIKKGRKCKQKYQAWGKDRNVDQKRKGNPLGSLQALYRQQTMKKDQALQSGELPMAMNDSQFVVKLPDQVIIVIVCVLFPAC